MEIPLLNSIRQRNANLHFLADGVTLDNIQAVMARKNISYEDYINKKTKKSQSRKPKPNEYFSSQVAQLILAMSNEIAELKCRVAVLEKNQSSQSATQYEDILKEAYGNLKTRKYYQSNGSKAPPL